jgi:hypothetical protein
MQKIPSLYRMIQGAISKKVVIKHYKNRIVVTKIPDMTRITPSERQRRQRDLFQKAVRYAQWILGNEQRKQAYKNTLPKKKRNWLYQAAISQYSKSSIEGRERLEQKMRSVRINKKVNYQNSGPWVALWTIKFKVEGLKFKVFFFWFII